MQSPAELEIARDLPPAGCSVGRSPALHALAGHAPLRKLSRRLLAAAAPPAASISTTSTPTAAGPTTWATKSPDPARALELLDGWEQELDRCYAGRPSHPVFVALAPTIRAFDIPAEPFRDLLARLPPGSDRASIRILGRRARLLPLLGESSRPTGAVSLRLPRRGAPAAFRRHLHRSAARQFLAGRLARPRKRPHLHSARTRCAGTASIRDDIEARRFDARYAALDEGPDRAHARAFCRGRAAARAGGRALARGPRSFRPRRPGRARRHRSAGLQHARASPRDRLADARCALLGARCRRRSLGADDLASEPPAARSAEASAARLRRLASAGHARRARSSHASYAECRRVARARRQQFLLRLLHAAAPQARCALRPLRLHAPGGRRLRHPRPRSAAASAGAPSPLAKTRRAGPLARSARPGRRRRHPGASDSARPLPTPCAATGFRRAISTI